MASLPCAVSGQVNTSSTTAINQHGVKQPGKEVDWLSATDFAARYPPSESRPSGGATHVLHPHNSPYYFDTARSGGVGGKINTRIGSQNAIFKGAQVHAGKHGIKPGDEIFISYGRSFNFNNNLPDDERQGWVHVRHGRVTRAGSTKSQPQIRSPPRPPPP